MNRAEYEHLQTMVLLIAKRHLREFTTDYMRILCIKNGLIKEDITEDDFGGKVIIPLLKNQHLQLVRSIPAGQSSIPVWAIASEFTPAS